MFQSLRVFLTVLTAFATVFLAAGLTAPQAQAACVQGVAGNDVLNMRSGPGTGYEVVDFLPPNVCGVRFMGPRSGNWAEVAWQGRSGWVSLRFICDGCGPGGGGGNRACVVGVAGNDVLNVRSGPGTRNRVVGIIPPDACGVRLGQRRGGWVRVNYRGLRGWASARFLD
ncbi:MAG: SH3 domain-containing protein [Pseudomonadota bacterium]